MEVRPFTVHVKDDILDDLRQRLGQTRFPDELRGVGWDYLLRSLDGVPCP